MESVILALGMLVFFGHLLVALFKRTRIPDVLLLMGIGIALGPFGLGWVKPEHFGEVGPVLTAIALIVILFEGGLGISLDTLVRAAVGTASITLATSAVTIAIIATVTQAHFGSWLPALLVGAILSGTSSAVVIPMLTILGIREKARTILSLESAITDVTCIVLTVGLLDAVLRGDPSPMRMAGLAISSLVAAGLLGALGGIAWLLVHRRLRAVPNTRLAIIAGVFVLYGLTEMMGFSGAIAALAFGIAVGHWSRPEAPERIGGLLVGRIVDDERELFAELVFLCKLVFFIYLGINLRFDRWEPYAMALQIVAAVYAARCLLARVLLPRDCTWRDAALTAVMAPKGLAAAVIASMVAQAGAPAGSDIKNITYAVVLVSILATSLLIPLIESPPAGWIARRFFRTHAEDDPATRPKPRLTNSGLLPVQR
ncbi:MAG: cation:proton antiporter [Planctomycetota bacterium]|nr:cation:proton antiporter [Planctomycetota bacterium]MCX8039433.1 cation:proton antiporter [Planctomycetota bacterium]MDW8373552.1 cation:proton antiporter [Planctomycetota bacterium]